MLIRSKKNGLDLFSHNQSVLDTAMVFNNKGNMGLSYEIIRYASIFHDLGKANPLFQSNITNNNFDNVCRHEISSILFIDNIPSKYRDIVALMIVSHHKSVDEDERGLCKLYEEDRKILFNNHINHIDKWGKTVVEFLKNHYNIDIIIPTEERCKEILKYYAKNFKSLTHKGYSKYRGLLMAADHFASCFYNDWERLRNIDNLFTVPTLESFYSVDERYPLSLIDIDIQKRHMICCAPCGCGKTNFALRCAGLRDNRVFYTLPFQASINAMYNRIIDGVSEGTVVTLKHGSITGMDILDDTTKKMSNFIGASIKVLTPFQFMTILFRLKGYESIILDIAGQTVILDEIHVYGGFQRTCIFELINVLKNLDCNVVIITATLPTKVKDHILDILGNDNVQVVKLTDEQLDTFNKHKIYCVDKFEDCYSEIVKRYNNNEKILIVCNQKRKARDIYREVKSKINGCNIMLLHSGFERKRKIELEKKLYEMNSSTERCILVSTQVVEVSIDINFDVLFTECAEIMSLLQRFGRVNRQRSDNTIRKDIFIVDVDEHSCLPYNEVICLRTFNELKKIAENKDNEFKVRESQELIDKIYSDISGFSDNKELACPYDENNEWKSNEFSHRTGTIASCLEFNGSIGILRSKCQEYKNEKNSEIEIPLGDGRKKINLRPLFENEDNSVYIIDDEDYSETEGFIL